MDLGEERRQAASPCQDCGACCASFRVSYYWGEPTALDLPEGLMEQVSPTYACMAGTNSAQPRCQALDGDVGKNVRCRVYDLRPSPCREVQPGDEKCNRARLLHGLPELANTTPAV